MLTMHHPSWSTMLAIVAATGAASSAQMFSIDDNPTAPFTGYQGIGFGAEDPYGIGLPPVMAGRIGPSPSLLHPLFGPFFDALEIFDCYADYNQDLTVNTLDVLAYLNNWAPKRPRADCDHDGRVHTRDVLCFLNAWTSNCQY